MKILGIDTTTRFLTIALSDGDKVYEYTLETGTRLSLVITDTIARILSALKWQLKDIDYFACGLGPGSFTGIRIGLATIKGLAWVTNKPMVGISTLDIIARNVLQENRPLVPIIDAKRKLIYSSMYRVNKGLQKRVLPYALSTKDELLKKLPSGSIVFGDAAALYKDDILKNIKAATVLEKDYWYPRPHNIIALAGDAIRKGRATVAARIQPIYIYPKECQIVKSHHDTKTPRHQ